MTTLFRSEQLEFHEYKSKVQNEVIRYIGMLSRSNLEQDPRDTVSNVSQIFSLAPLTLGRQYFDILENENHFSSSTCTLVSTIDYKGSKILWELNTHEFGSPIHAHNITSSTIEFRSPLEILKVDKAKSILRDIRSTLDDNLRIQGQIVSSYNSAMHGFIQREVERRIEKLRLMDEIKKSINE